MLPSNLRKLGLNFNVEVKKAIYPYLFLNHPNIKPNYLGNVTSYNKFYDINKQQYTNYCRDFNNN